MIYIITSEGRSVGMFSYVAQVLRNLSAIDETGDKLYVDFSYDDITYKDLRYGNNIWDYYFSQPFDDIHSDDLNDPKNIRVLFMDNTVNFNSPIQDDDMINKGRRLCKKYIKIHPHILKKVNDYLYSVGLLDTPYFSIHKRGTDHRLDTPLLPIDRYFQEADSLFDEYEYCILCTDETHTVDAFKTRYGNKVHTYDAIRSNDTRGIHWKNGAITNNPYKAGEDVIIDALLMSNSDYLIRTISGVTFFSIYYNENLRYRNIDTHIR